MNNTIVRNTYFILCKR